MTYQQTVEYLFNRFPLFQNIGAGAYKEGTENIATFCKELDNPQNDYFTIHVAGTNGKGSVAHILASILQQAGYRVGLFTSPHLTDFRERIKVDGVKISERYVVRFVEEHREQMEQLGLSFFEATTAMAFQYFAHSDVEVAVIETGLGGRLDATNIIKPILSIITNIGLEHTRYLGDTLDKIAAEKAGIIKRGVPVVVGESCPQTDEVFREVAHRNHSKLVFADQKWEVVDSRFGDTSSSFDLHRPCDGRTQTIELDLAGHYQRKNIITVRAAVTLLRHDTPLNISTRALLSGCRTVCETTGLRGRWQVVLTEPMVVCDTGHNAHGIKEVTAQVAQCHYRKLFVIFGLANDKDLGEILPLLPQHAYYIFTRASVDRAMPAEEIAAAAERYGLQGEVQPTVAEAYDAARAAAAPEDMILVGGSTFIVSDFFKHTVGGGAE
ncbi:MAG: bifunctional folylpolyglutamate synthase/dihydrofolate synthase [Tidjanibacter sp.]|nr:bifunctional folylpolyglutamate synthase/dihydrofolate synthase [Tidjanibacter sp.]